MSKDATLDVAPATPPSLTQDAEKSGDGVPYIPEDRREKDFMTRNGLNLRSFERRDYGTGEVELDRSMKQRHLHMIAIGGSIGAGFFVGSGGALTKGGPGAVLICFSIAGIMIFNVVHALGELAVMYLLLTGPNGFVGAHVLSGLLNAGYRVRGVVRSLAKATHLEKSHAEHVKSGDLTFECVPDIQRDSALDAAMADVDFCCHVASPYFTTSDNPLQDLIEPAVNGTRNVMESALKSTTLKRLTVMSSFASVVDLAKNPRPGYVYTSNDWDPLTVEEGAKDGYLAYHVSKTEAERVAWEMHKKADPPARFDIVTFCPPMIYGPPLHEVDPSGGIAGLNTSLKRLLSSVAGLDPTDPGRVPTFGLPAFVDVRNVADAHVAALSLKKGVSERFTLCGGMAYFEDGLAGLRAAGEQGLGREGDKIEKTAWYTIDRTRAEDVLGLNFIKFENTVADTWQWAKETGLVPRS